jgi:prophage maintenance system killer protein
MATETTDIAIYEGPGGTVEVRLDRESVWLTQRQMAELFDSSADNVGLHINNIYKNQELNEISTTEDYSVVRQEGKRRIQRKLKHYNLDVIISVGYRVNSRRGVQFRQWATRLLKEHLTRGYTLNRQRFEENARELEAALALVRKAAGSDALSGDQGRGLVDVIARYTQTFLLLQRYDEGLLTEPKGTVGGALPPIAEARTRIAALKKDLMARGDAGDLFGQERETNLESILGNLDQTAFGEPAYPSIESKAAHLLYFVIKNHPFSDGNKRIGSFLFVDFLDRNGRLFRDGEPIVNDIGLAALALLVAESDPKHKDVLIRLVMNMLTGGA